MATEACDGSECSRREATLPQRLKAETRDVHERLEARLDLPRDNFSLADLALLLQRFYGLYLPCETALEGLPDDLRPLFLGRRKTHLLHRDLEWLGMSHGEIASLPSCQVPGADGLAATLGRWYVLEGSTLGGQVLNRWLTDLLGLERGSLFFASYGDQVGPMWRAYCQRLDEVSLEERDLVVAAARETFELVEDWLCSADRVPSPAWR